MTYLNVEEVESAIQGLVAKYPSLTERIELPNKTFEGRTCHALRIGADSHADAAVFTACQHAREWGGAEVCIFLASDLLEAFTNRTGLSYGGKSFGSVTVRSIVKNFNVIIFPCVNPDGSVGPVYYQQQILASVPRAAIAAGY